MTEIWSRRSGPDTDLAKRSYCKIGNKKVAFASTFKEKRAQYPYNAVDNFGDKVVDKVKEKSSDDLISPYLRRPLRSFADALAERDSGRVMAAEAKRARLIVSQNRDPDAQERLSA